MRILCIEDDLELAKGMNFHLKLEGYDVDCCFNGLDGLELIKSHSFDLVILDRMLPQLDGISVLTQLRTLGLTTPVILVTALDGIGDRVKGLDAGADDYLVKPFAIDELLARVRALSRRPSQITNTRHLKLGDVTLDLLGLSLFGPKRACSLSKREATLIEIFIKNPNEPLSRSLILSKVWGPDTEVEDGNIDNYIYFIRRRLTTVGSQLHIKTIRSIGYMLELTHA